MMDKKYTQIILGQTSKPSWLDIWDIHYLVKMGSHSYGISNQNSDVDIYGFCIPPIEYIFPHVKGEILGFGKQTQRFEQYQQEHLESDGQEYDISIYNIVKFFQLCMDNNPNMIDSLFVPDECIIYSNTIGNLVRNNRRFFLHKGCYWRFMGYAESQLKKIKNKNPIGKRKQIVDKFGFDTKYASHLYRLADECEQILTNHDLNLRRASSVMLAIRNGEKSLKWLEEWFENKKLELKQLYETSTLQYSPNEEKIHELLVEALEIYYGKLEKFGFNFRKAKHEKL